MVQFFQNPGVQPAPRSHSTTAWHTGLSSAIRLPFSSNTQSVPPSSLASACADTLYCAPAGQETRAHAVSVADSPAGMPNGSTGTTGVTRSVQSTSAGRPLKLVTVSGADPVFRRTRVNSTGVLT